MKTVQELRQEGYQVKVRHLRVTKQEQVQPKGGTTIVDVTHPKGLMYSGAALCSKKDPYNRKLGLTIALGRAMKNFKR